MYTVPLVQWAPLKEEKTDVVVHSIGKWCPVDRRVFLIPLDVRASNHARQIRRFAGGPG